MIKTSNPIQTKDEKSNRIQKLWRTFHSSLSHSPLYQAPAKLRGIAYLKKKKAYRSELP